jgi:hypothetical protein
MNKSKAFYAFGPVLYALVRTGFFGSHTEAVARDASRPVEIQTNLLWTSVTKPVRCYDYNIHEWLIRDIAQNYIRPVILRVE